MLSTFSSLTHLSALRKGWHVAYFVDGTLCVLASSLGAVSRYTVIAALLETSVLVFMWSLAEF